MGCTSHKKTRVRYSKVEVSSYINTLHACILCLTAAAGNDFDDFKEFIQLPGLIYHREKNQVTTLQAYYMHLNAQTERVKYQYFRNDGCPYYGILRYIFDVKSLEYITDLCDFCPDSSSDENSLWPESSDSDEAYGPAKMEGYVTIRR